jgi:predicted Zn finger-like uncharacterized protein
VQAPCPNCQHTIRIDDAKVPDRAFSVKCPKCQTVVKFPGKAAAAVAPPPAPEPPPPPAPAPAPATAPEAGLDEMKAQMMAQLRREMGGGAAAASGSAGRAMVALPDRGQAGAITLSLSRLGFAVEALDDYDEGSRLLEQGAYNLLVTSRQALAQGRESVYQRLGRLQPEARRNLFVILVGDEYKTGDGTQAFTCYVDVVVNAREAASCDGVLRTIMQERQRMYQPFTEARRRFDSA